MLPITMTAIPDTQRDTRPPLDPMTIPEMKTKNPLLMTLEEIEQEKDYIHDLRMQFVNRVDSQHPRFQALDDRDMQLAREVNRRRNLPQYLQMIALAASPGMALGTAWSFFRGGSVIRGAIIGGVVTVVAPLAILWLEQQRRQQRRG